MPSSRAAAGAWGGPNPAERAASYGMPTGVVDGSDVVVVEEAVMAAVEAARTGAGPAFLEMQTHRLGGHYEGDAQPYRDEEELKEWRAVHDPVAKLRGRPRSGRPR